MRRRDKGIHGKSIGFFFLRFRALPDGRRNP
jgi:hypothetical protein